MYNAPAVTYPVGRSHFQAGLTWAVLLAGAVAQVTWWLLSAAPGPLHGLGGVLWLVVSGWALWRGLHVPQGQLAWDGREWRWHTNALSSAVTPQIILDVQHSLLLCLRPENGSPVWVWPAQQAQPGRWLALRRALFNPAVPPDSSRLAVSPEV